MSANLIPISSDGGFTTGGNITVSSFPVASPSPSINGFSSINAVDNIHVGSNLTLSSTGNIVFNSNIYLVNGYTISSLDDIGGQVDYNNRTMGYGADNNGSASLYARDSAGLGNNNAVVTANATNGTVAILAANTAGPNKNWTFDGAGNLTLPGNTFAVNYANGSPVTSVTTVLGSWTLATGVNTVSISVPLNGTYSIWVNGNIPNGIITYTATAVVTNNNVPVLGSQYGWYYLAGGNLVLDSLPAQIVGTAGSISTATVVTTTANVFTFGITNNSGATQVVNYGYTKF
jgi:hypothetical protein